MALPYVPKVWISELDHAGPPANPGAATPISGLALTTEFTALRDYVRGMASTGALTPNHGRTVSGLTDQPVLRSFVDYSDFVGASLNGVTDGAPAMRFAVARMAVDGGTLWVGDGTCLLNSMDANSDCVPVPAGCKGVRIQGAGYEATFIKGSANCKRFIDPAADYEDGDRYCHVWILDLTWDDDNVGGSEHKLAGSWKRGWWVARINIDHIGAFRVRTINIPAGAQAGSFRFGVTDLLDQPTQYNITDIWLCEFEFNGGTFGAVAVGALTGGGGSSVNVYHARIHFRDGIHINGNVSPIDFAYGAHVHLGSQGWGGEECDIVNVHGKFSPDVSFEADIRCIMRRCTAEDPHTHHFLHAIFNPKVLTKGDKCTFEHCIALALTALNNVGAFTPNSFHGPIGEFAVLHCQYIKAFNEVYNLGVGQGCALQAGQIGVFAGIPVCDIAFLNVVDLTIIDYGTVWPAANGSMWSAYINLNLSTAPTVLPRIKLDVTFDIDFTNNATGTDGVIDYGFIVNGNATLECSFTVSHAVHGAVRTGQFTIGYLGGNTGNTGPPVASTSTLSGKINVKVRGISGDLGPKGFTVAGSGTLTIPAGQFIEFNSDWGNWTGPNSNRVILSAVAQSRVVAELRQSGLRRVTGDATIDPNELGVIALTPGARVTLPTGMWLAHASASYLVVNGAGAAAGLIIATTGAQRIGNNLAGVVPAVTETLDNAGAARVYTPDTNFVDLVKVGG